MTTLALPLVLAYSLVALGPPELRAGPAQTLTALFAGVLGLAIGYFLTVYGLRVW